MRLKSSKKNILAIWINKEFLVKILPLSFIILILLNFNIDNLFSFTKNIHFGTLNNPLDSLVITWHSNASSDRIKWGYTQNYEEGTFNGISRDYHSGEFLVDYQFPQLLANSLIYYQIQNNEMWGDEKIFNTTTSPDSVSFSFTFGGDSRDSIHHWQQISNAIQSADFGIHLGDMVGEGNSYEEWDLFFEYGENFILSNLIYPVIGNHDLGPDNIYENIYRYPSEDLSKKYYSFEYENTIFISLDSENANDPEQLLWLESQLYKFRKKMWKIVAFHRPFYTTGRHGGEMDDFFATWWQKFDDYGVDFILTSHTHNYMRTVPIKNDTLIVDYYGNNESEGICQIVAGGYGAPLYPSSVAIFVEESESVFHYGKITIDDMQLLYEAKDHDNFVFDSLRIDKRLIINEINYNSSQFADSKDWIELFNPREREIDISSYVFKDGDDNNEFLIPANTIIPSKGYLVITRNNNDFEDIYPDVTNKVGDFDFGLSNTGEMLRIYDTKEILLDSVIYSAENPWPIQANGGGHSLELSNWKKDNNDFSSWEASLGFGSPGRINSMFQVLEPIIITEINYNSSPSFDPDDWIELYNPNNFSMDISNYKFMDGDPFPFYTIPSDTEIDPNSYLVLCKNSNNFSYLFPDVENFIGDFGFGLSGSGEPIRLYNSFNVLVDTVRYDDQFPWPIEPDGNGPTLELINPEFNNILAESWATSIAENGTPGQENSVNIENNYEFQINNFDLEQNYPNPFNPVTKIRYQLPVIGDQLAKIVIHNSAGQMLWSKNLLTNHSSPTIGYCTFNGSKFNSGIYYYSLIIDDKRMDSKKMILLK